MDDLHTRLHAAITARRELAERARRGNGWRVDLAGRRDEVWTGESKPGHTPIPIGQMWDPQTATFIAANDPAQILRDCVADLAILAEIAGWKHAVVEGDCWYTCPAATEEREGETNCDEGAGTDCDCGLDSRRGAILAALASAYPGATS